MSMLEYNGYFGTVDFSAADRVFYGKIFGINDVVTFEGTTVEELESSFRSQVDDYLQTCKEIGKEPEKMFKGVFNVRIKPELHKKAVFEAGVLGQTLNEFVEKSIALRIEQITSFTKRAIGGRTYPGGFDFVVEEPLDEYKPAGKKPADSKRAAATSTAKHKAAAKKKPAARHKKK